MDYNIVIPSYKRASTLTNKTLSTLKSCGISSNKIYVFVANEDEYAEYSQTLPKDMYHEIIIGVETLHAQRNFIRNYFPNNALLFYLDDDIEGFYIKKGDKLVPFKKLDSLIKFGFALCKKYSASLCGIYPVHNAYFMKNTVNIGLYYIIGCCYWNINLHNPSLNVALEDKEDFERSIKEYLNKGSVLRINNITVKTNYYTEPGGMQVTRTEERVTKSALALLAKYPQLVELNKNRKKHTEIKFKRQKNNSSFKIGA